MADPLHGLRERGDRRRVLGLASGGQVDEGQALAHQPDARCGGSGASRRQPLERALASASSAPVADSPCDPGTLPMSREHRGEHE